MKRFLSRSTRLLLVMLMVMTMFMAFAAPALAIEEGPSAVIPSGEFFTWDILLTYAGAVAATILVTQMCKGVGVISKIPTRIFSYFVAVIVLILATLFSGMLTLSSGVICLINAAVVSLAANGTVDGVKQLTGSYKS